MKDDLLRGKLVRLVVEPAEVVAEALSRWSRNSEYWRLLAADPARLISVKSTKEWLEKAMEKDPPDFYMFVIRTLADDRLIGEIGMDGAVWHHGDTFIGISIGEPSDWGKGYGTDAMGVLLRYAFTEMNLWRVSLSVFEYNSRAIRSYEKAGFQVEGRERKYIHRDGERYDMIFMGLLRSEWQALQH